MRTTLTYNNWTKEEENKLKSLVGTTSFTKMVEFFPNRTPTSLLKKSVKLGYKSTYKHFKYSVNINYWKELDLNKCYYAGFIASDGNLSKRTWQVQLNLSSKDVQILHDFKKAIDFDGNVAVYKRKKYQSEELKEVCTLCINRVKEWYKDLKEKFNITIQKTFTLQPPNLNDKYLEIAYLIGLIDGDGWVCKMRNKNRITIGFVGASLPMVQWVKMKFDSILNSNYNVKRDMKNGILKNYYSIVLQDKYAAPVIDYLSQFPVPKLERKWSNPLVLKYIDEQKLKHPELFIKLNPEEISQYLPKPKDSLSQAAQLV